MTIDHHPPLPVQKNLISHPTQYLTQALMIQEFLQFSEYGDRDWTVTYLTPEHDMIDKILKVGLRFDLLKHGPDTEKVTENARTTPGSVPGKPPIFS